MLLKCWLIANTKIGNKDDGILRHCHWLAFVVEYAFTKKEPHFLSKWPLTSKFVPRMSHLSAVHIFTFSKTNYDDSILLNEVGVIDTNTGLTINSGGTEGNIPIVWYTELCDSSYVKNTLCHAFKYGNKCKYICYIIKQPIKLPQRVCP